MQAAYDRLFVERHDLANSAEVIGHAVAIIECLLPGLSMAYVEKVRAYRAQKSEEERREALAARSEATREEGDEGV